MIPVKFTCINFGSKLTLVPPFYIMKYREQVYRTTTYPEISEIKTLELKIITQHHKI